MNKLSAVLSCQGVSKTFVDAGTEIQVLKNIDFVVLPGEFIAIVGASGAGKSTFLQILAGLEKPSSGCFSLAEQDYAALSESQQCHMRNQKIGFVYQQHHLLPEFTALENVAMPALVAGSSISKATEKARELLCAVGLENRMQHKAAQLSGGERQRVSIARALVNDPACVLADEPTGNLDQHTAQEVLSVMTKLVHERGMALVVVTHDTNVASHAQRILTLEDGCFV